MHARMTVGDHRANGFGCAADRYEEPKGFSLSVGTKDLRTPGENFQRVGGQVGQVRAAAETFGRRKSGCGGSLQPTVDDMRTSRRRDRSASKLHKRCEKEELSMSEFAYWLATVRGIRAELDGNSGAVGGRGPHFAGWKLPLKGIAADTETVVCVETGRMVRAG